MSYYEKKDKWGKNAKDLFKELLKEELGIGDYAVVYGTGEGYRLPTGIESESMVVLTKDGIVRYYNLEWNSEKINPDGEKGYYTLAPEEPFSEEGMRDFQSNPNYLYAREKLGLSLTKEQKEILEKDRKEFQKNWKSLQRYL